MVPTTASVLLNCVTIPMDDVADGSVVVKLPLRGYRLEIPTFVGLPQKSLLICVTSVIYDKRCYCLITCLHF